VQTVHSLPMETSENVSLKARVEAPHAFPAEGTVSVQVQNVPIASMAESELWYCNDPENVRFPGQLFAAELLPNNPARLLYHHINQTDGGLFIYIHAINPSNTPAQVLIIPGESNPDRNPVLAGLRAGDQFLRNWIHNSGEIVTIPPNGEIPIALSRLSPRETTSGLTYLRLLPGGPDRLLVRTDAKDPGEMNDIISTPLASPAPWRVYGPLRMQQHDVDGARLSEHIYPHPIHEQDVDYRVGGRYGFVRIGQKAIRSFDQQRGLEGNFGVTYSLKISMTNPTPDPVDVEVVFESSAGYSGALFVVNGKMLRTPLLQPKEEVQIAKVHLEPSESQSIKVLTIPLSGSSYPATLTVRPTNVR
jgi:hypothetical protein